MSRYFRDDYTSWSFVFPIALAVMIGVLAADVVRLMVAGVMARVALQEINESLRKQTTPGHLPARYDSTETPPQEPATRPGTSSAPELPGLLQAKRNGLDRACIGGTVSLRETNGWSQDTSTGSPQPCTATSP